MGLLCLLEMRKCCCIETKTNAVVRLLPSLCNERFTTSTGFASVQGLGKQLNSNLFAYSNVDLTLSPKYHLNITLNLCCGFIHSQEFPVLFSYSMTIELYM